MNNFWIVINEFMTRNYISFKDACYLFEVTPNELDKFSEEDYDYENDPNYKKIIKILDYLHQKHEEEKIDKRFYYAKLNSSKESFIHLAHPEKLGDYANRPDYIKDGDTKFRPCYFYKELKEKQKS